MYGWLSRIAAFAAVACAIGAAWSYFTPEPRPTLEAVNLTTDVGEIPLNVETPAKFVFRNTGSTPKRILNVAPACGMGACWRAESDDPITVPPYGEATFIILLKPTKPGPFTVEPTLYLDDVFLRSVELTFTGIGGPANVPQTVE